MSRCAVYRQAKNVQIFETPVSSFQQVAGTCLRDSRRASGLMLAVERISNPSYATRQTKIDAPPGSAGQRVGLPDEKAHGLVGQQGSRVHADDRAADRAGDAQADQPVGQVVTDLHEQGEGDW